jgi:hypothetical protein
MEKVPQSVIVRLKGRSPSLQHPDADTLTAFAERSVSSSQREVVLEHLAHCGECREVVALALPSTEPTQVIVRPAPKAWLTWPVIRWGAVAAGVLVVGSFVIVHYQHQNAAQVAIAQKASQEFPEAKNVPPPAPEAARNEEKFAQQLPGAPQRVEHRDLKQTQEQRQADASKLDVATSNTLALQQNAPAVMRVMPPAADKDVSSQSAGASPSPAPAQNGLVSDLAEKRANSDASAGLQPESPRSDEAYRLARVEKSKPAMPSSPSATARSARPVVGGNLAQMVSVSPASVVQWNVSSTGALQRSFDQGNSWETVDVNRSGVAGAPAFGTLQKKATVSKTESAAIVFRTVTSNGTDVWAGARNGILYRSTDAGIRWIRIMPQADGTTLTGDIVSLEFTGQNGRIVTSAPEIWTTSDAGQTWHKQ